MHMDEALDDFRKQKPEAVTHKRTLATVEEKPDPL
jgi:hypothetical protein